MSAYIAKKNMVKAQSIIEYLVVLSAIIIVILINTIGFHAGVQNSLGLQNSLNVTQNTVGTTIIRQEDPTATVRSQPYYTPSEEHTSNPAGNPDPDNYGGPDYNGGYDYNTWVHNDPNSAYNARRPGDIRNQPGVNNGGNQQ